MDNSKEIYYSTNGSEAEPPKDEILAVLVARKEPPEDIANFIIWEYLYNTPFYSFHETIRGGKIRTIIPPEMWEQVAKYLAIFLALAEFKEYTELQYLRVLSCGQSYVSMKTAQYCEQENPKGKRDILRLQNFSFPNFDFSQCNEKAKEAGETLYNAIVNFKSAMAAARDWAREHGAENFTPANFDEQENVLKKFLPLWKEIFKDVDKITYFRKERACFNYYKITGDNYRVIEFTKAMLDNYYYTQMAYLLH